MFRKRLGDFLARRGFSYDVARDAIDRLWEEFGDPDNESAGHDLERDWED
jgi:hypothetical protein